MSMLFNKKPIVINADLAKAIGLNEAIVLQQLHYWLNETASGIHHNGARWIFNTQQQWQDQFPFWSVVTIKRTFASLLAKGLIRVDQLNKSRHDRTNYYTLRYDQIDLLDAYQNEPFDGINLIPSSGSKRPHLTETTTETTTEKVLVPAAAETPDPGDKIPYEQIRELYNRILGGSLPRCLGLNDKHRKHIRAAYNLKLEGKHVVREGGLEFWEGLFHDVLDCPFLLGQNNRAWKADFSFLTTATKIQAFFEGKYDAC